MKSYKLNFWLLAFATWTAGTYGSETIVVLPPAFDLCRPNGGVFLRTGWLLPTADYPEEFIVCQSRLSNDLSKDRPHYEKFLATNTDLEASLLLHVHTILALAYTFDESPNNAEQHLRSALQVATSPKYEDNIVAVEEAIGCMLLAGAIYEEHGDVATARSYFAKAGEILDSGPVESPLLKACALYLGANALSEIGDDRSAWIASRAAFDHIRDIRHDAPSEYVMIGCQLLLLCRRVDDCAYGSGLSKELDDFIRCRKDKLGLAIAHWYWAYAVLQANDGNYSRALKCCEQCSETYRHVFGANSIAEAPLFGLHADILVKMSNQNGAEALLQEVIESYSHRYGADRRVVKWLSSRKAGIEELRIDSIEESKPTPDAN